MLKPREGYLIAEVVTKKTNSGIVLPDEKNIANKTISVKSVPKGCDIKIGTEIVLSGNCQLQGIKDEDKDYLIVPVDGIVATR